MALTGDSIPDYVKTQIDARQKVYGSGVNQSRTADQLFFTNLNTSWVKLASGVSVTDTQKLTDAGLSTNLSGTKLAKQNILFGGLSSLTDDNLLQKDGTNAYNFSEFGFVPMAGITYTDVKTLGKGSIKKSTVRITANTKTQFAIINMLYMRIGYTVLLEWGNSHYLDDKGNIETVNNTLIEDYFFDSSSDGDFSFILPKIDKKREKYHANYDALLGKISNFDWNFTNEGSYEITLTISSLGDVVESLKTNIPLSNETVKFLNVFRQNGVSTGNSAEVVEKNKDDNLISSLLFLFRFVDQSNPVEKKKINIVLTDGTPREVGYFLDTSQYVSGSNGNDPSGSNPSTITVVEQDYTYFIGSFNPLSGAYNVNSQDKRITGISGSATDSLDQKARAELINVWNTTFATNSSTPKATTTDIQSYTTTDTNLPALIISKNPTGSPGGEYSVWMHPKVSTSPVYVAPAATSAVTTVISNPLKSAPLGATWKLNTVTPQYYIKLQYLLQYIKENIVPIVEGGKKNPILKIDNSLENNPMYCIPFAISLDPRVCAVKNDNFIKINNKPQKVFTELESWIDSTNSNKAYSMNIYLNFEFVISCINDNVDEKGDLSLFSFLQAICTGLNRALGGVNNLEPVIDEETNTIRILDSTPIPGTFKKSTGIFDIYGYKGTKAESNFVREISLKTVITPELATMLTVGATSSGYVKGVEGTAFKHFNDGIIDRFNDELLPSNPGTSSTEAEDNYVNDFLKWVNLCFGLNGNIFENPPNLGELDEGIIKKNVSLVTEYYKYFLAKKQSDNQAGTVGFIPFKLNFTVDGISGIKLYNQITIDTSFLPKAYGKTLIFIVTGINHKIQKHDWITEITATPIPKTNSTITPTRPPKDELTNSARAIYLPSSATVSSTITPSGPGLDPLKNLIASKESNGGDYEIYNYGPSGGTGIRTVTQGSSYYSTSAIKLTDKTVTQIISLQSQKKLFAVGKYQTIPITLNSAATKLGIGSSLFNSSTQEQIGDWLLLTTRSSLGKYLKGENTGSQADLEAAVQSLGQEFASLPIITKSGTKWGNVVTGEGNKAYYGGSGPNPDTVSVTVGEVVKVMIKSRVQYSSKQPSFIPTYYTP